MTAPSLGVALVDVDACGIAAGVTPVTAEASLMIATSCRLVA
jgi:hypothetical protein